VPWAPFAGALAYLGRFNQLQMTVLDLRDLGVDVGLAFLQLGNSRAGFSLVTSMIRLSRPITVFTPDSVPINLR
jgi:hypothetical protein